MLSEGESHLCPGAKREKKERSSLRDEEQASDLSPSRPKRKPETKRERVNKRKTAEESSALPPDQEKKKKKNLVVSSVLDPLSVFRSTGSAPKRTPTDTPPGLASAVSRFRHGTSLQGRQARTQLSLGRPRILGPFCRRDSKKLPRLSSHWFQATSDAQKARKTGT